MPRENQTGVFEIPQDPKLADLFRAALRNLKVQIRTHTVGTVTAYDAATQRADVSVDVLQVVRDNFTQPTTANPNPVATLPAVQLKGIPVAWPRAGSSYLTFPLSAGDTGEVHIQDRNLGQWIQLGDAVDPVSAITHALADGVFHPNIHPDNDPITPPTDEAAAVLEGEAIKLGRLAALGVARLTDTTAADVSMSAWITSVNAAISAIATILQAPPPGTPVVTVTGAIIPPIPPSDFGVISSASSKVTAE